MKAEEERDFARPLLMSPSFVWSGAAAHIKGWLVYKLGNVEASPNRVLHKYSP